MYLSKGVSNNKAFTTGQHSRFLLKTLKNILTLRAPSSEVCHLLFWPILHVNMSYDVPQGLVALFVLKFFAQSGESSRPGQSSTQTPSSLALPL